MFEQTFMLRILPPWEGNLKQRLIKSPKVSLRDTGLLHSLLGIESLEDLYGHPGMGSSWESFCVENILSRLPLWKSHFYRTSSGSEIDLVLTRGKRRIGVEFKCSLSPNISKSLRLAG